MTKANVTQQEKYKAGIVPMEDIEKHAPAAQVGNEKLTESQAELVHAILHNGCNPSEAAQQLGRNKA